MVEILWGFVSSTIRLVLEGLVGSISGIVDSVSGIFDGSDAYRISIATSGGVEVAACGPQDLDQSGVVEGSTVHGREVDFVYLSICSTAWGMAIWYPTDNGGNPVWTVLGEDGGAWRALQTFNVFIDQPHLSESGVRQYVTDRIAEAGAPERTARAIVEAWPGDGEVNDA